MHPLPSPFEETARLARLQELFVLDSEPEPLFDSFVRMASEVCGAPIALITLIDAERQWFKANIGLAGINETPRDISFCTYTILDDALMEVPDTRLDPRFEGNPFVAGEPDVRFYAGAPLILPGGERLGTLCVADRFTRRLDEAQARTLRWLAGLVTEALLMRRDLITRTLAVRSQYEQALVASAAEYTDLYDNAPCGYHSTDSEGRFVRINKTALRWLGCSREEALGGLGVGDFLNPGDRARLGRDFERLKSEGSVHDLEMELIGRDGVTRRLLTSATLVRDAGGRFLMTRTVTYDVTELRRVRDEHEKLMAERNAILDTDLVGIVKVTDRHVAWCNRGAEKLFGYGPGELDGQPTRMLYPDEDAYRRAGEVHYPHPPIGKVYRCQLQVMRKDGSLVWIDLSATSLAESPKDPVCVVLDISALKRAEEIRARALALEAENRQLIEASRVNGAFLSNMSHELYTPLNAIIGYSHMLQSGVYAPDSPKFARYLGQIGESGQQLLALIRTALDFADNESGRLELKPEPVDLRAVIGSVVDTVKAQAREKGVTLSTAIDDTLVDVVLDPLRLAQTVSHYLSNAVKFSNRGGSVAISARPDGEGRLRVEVADRGIGIAPADLPKLFAPFRQLSQGNSKAYAGAGLSLSLTRRLVEAQGGTVGVESVLGEGSVFWFTVPRGG